MIASPVTTSTMRAIELFRGFNESEYRQIAEIAATATFGPGQMVLEQGATCQTLWIVLSGKCEVTRAKPDDPAAEALVLATLEPYSHFGEMSFFHPAPHSASVRAQTDVQLLRIGRADYDDLIAEGATSAYKLAYNVVGGLAERLRRMDEWLSQLNHHEPVPTAARTQPPAEWARFRDKLFNGWNL